MTLIQFSALEAILAKDYVGAIWVVDDLAFGSGPMIFPEAFREHVSPGMGRWLIAAMRKIGCLLCIQTVM